MQPGNDDRFRMVLQHCAERMMENGVVELRDAVRHFTLVYLEAALADADGNISKAARRMGVHRNTFSRLRQQCGGGTRKLPGVVAERQAVIIQLHG